MNIEMPEKAHKLMTHNYVVYDFDWLLDNLEDEMGILRYLRDKRIDRRLREKMERLMKESP